MARTKTGPSLPLIIEGPTVRGTFFIRDQRNRVWDGDEWRGFGYPAEWKSFGPAFVQCGKLSDAAKQKSASNGDVEIH